MSAPGVIRDSPAVGGMATTVSDALVAGLLDLGVEEAFGVSGGAMAALWHAMSSSALRVRHFRHESGATFAAIEASFASHRPVAVFTTTGPGLTNALTGVLAARDEGARIILLSAFSPSTHWGRWPIQETSPHTLPGDLYTSGSLFHFATVLESATQLPQVVRRLALGLAKPGGFVANIALPTALQMSPASALPPPFIDRPSEAPAPSVVERAARALAEGPLAIWVGFGARDAAAEVRALARRLGAPVFCSPRGKGIFPEEDPLFAGVTGLFGHESVIECMARLAPHRILVLGSRLGECTSFWDPRMVPPGGFVHVDVDPKVPGMAYPEAETLAVEAEVGGFLRALLAAWPRSPLPAPVYLSCRATTAPRTPPPPGRVRPEALMDAIQRRIVERSDAIVLAESGNSFAWTTHHLRFATPGRYRVSTRVGAMGHATTGVVGAALATGRKAVAVVGDGAMLMNNEVNTAVKFGVLAVWVVLNDARYGMCAQGMATLGLSADASFPRTDFVALAHAQGADGVRVEAERDLDQVLDRAMEAPGPFVIDVRIDPSCLAPTGTRNRSLRAQMQGTDPDRPAAREASFPVRRS